MLRPVPMTRVEIYVLQRELAALSRELARAGILHTGKIEVFHLGKEEKERCEGRDLMDEYRSLERDLVRVMSRMGLETSAAPFPEWENLLSVRPWIDNLDIGIRKLLGRKEELSASAMRITDLLSFLRPMAGIRGTMDELADLRFVCLRAGFFPLQRALSALSALPEGVSGTLLPERSGEEAFCLFLAPASQTERVDRFLGENRFRPFRTPSGLHGTFSGEKRRVEVLLDQINGRMRRLEEKLQQFKRENEELLRRRLAAVRAEIRLLETRTGFGFTERTAVIGGWVPRKRLGELNVLLEKTCGNRAALNQETASGNKTPVLLFNPALVRPFQKILSVYGTPSYDELEPTPLLAIGFLVLFGMMFGDVGHGMVLVGVGLLLRSKTRFRDEGLIVTEVGVFALFFGFLFGSFFGHENLFAPLWFSPMENIGKLMAAALAVGAGLILTGLSLRVWDGLRRGERSVLYDRHGLAGLIFYGGALITGYLVLRDLLPMAAVLWLIAPLIGILFHPILEQKAKGNGGSTAVAITEGLVEVMETVLGFATNTISFLRVAAFGLAHVGLSMAVLAMTDQVRSAPFGIVWVVIIYIFGHALILLLEGLVVSVQTVRLEFYEVFSKFFRGEGVSYNPLSFDSLQERRR